MSEFFKVKNWPEFQHYSSRNPPWIKLHRAILDDVKFMRLPELLRGELLLIWVLASQNGGRVPNDPRFVASRIGASRPVNLKALVEAGFLVPENKEENTIMVTSPASEVLAECKQVAQVTQRPEEKRREEKKELAGFARFWLAWPQHHRKADRGRCLKRWIADALEDKTEQVVAHVVAMRDSQAWRKDAGEFVPAPLVYLNQQRYDAPLPNVVPISTRSTKVAL